MDPSLLDLPDSVVAGIHAGQTIAIPDHSRTIAILLPAAVPSKPRPCGLAKGEFTIPDDFNDPVPELEAEIYGEV